MISYFAIVSFSLYVLGPGMTTQWMLSSTASCNIQVGQQQTCNFEGESWCCLTSTHSFLSAPHSPSFVRQLLFPYSPSGDSVKVAAYQPELSAAFRLMPRFPWPTPLSSLSGGTMATSRKAAGFRLAAYMHCICLYSDQDLYTCAFFLYSYIRYININNKWFSLRGHVTTSPL